MEGFERFEDGLHLWRLVTAYTALLSVYLIILGMALAGLVTALKKREGEGWSR